MFLKVLSKIEKVGVILAALLVLVMMVLTTVDTFFRDALNSPIPGVYELNSLLMVGVLYLGLSYVQAQRGHIRMDLLSSHLSPSNQLILQLLSDVIFLSVAVLITWQMAIQFWHAFLTGDYLFGAIKIPLWPAKLALVLGTSLVSLRLISDIVTNPIWLKQPGTSQYRYVNRILVALGVLALLAALIVIGTNLNLSAPTAGWIALAMFLIMLLIGVPIASSMALIGICGFLFLSGPRSALGVAGTTPFASAAEYTMTVLPLYIAMGIFAGLAGFAENGFELARRWLEQIKGGIVHATIVGATFFAAATGSGAASCAVLSKITVPEMLKRGVRKDMAIGVVSSVSTLAIMIPPSTTFVIYAMLTGNSIGKLLIAGVIPGLIGAAMIMATVYIRCKLDPKLVATGYTSRFTWKERFSAIPRAWGVAIIVVVIIGGILTGVFTPTEGGAIGAFVAFVAVLALRKGSKSQIYNVLTESAGLASTILFIIVGGMLFGTMVSITRLPVMLSEWVVSLDVAPLVILIIIMFIYFILGCFVDSLTMMIITLPIVYPVIIKLGFDPIWFGVLQVQNMEIAAVTPPYGMNLFIMKGALPDTTTGEIFRGVLWFIVPLLLTMVIYIAFPQVSLWLPSLI